MRERPPLPDSALVAALAAGWGWRPFPPPWATRGGRWAPASPCWCFPWVDGVPAMELGLTDRQWADLGGFVAGLHRSALPAELAATVARESFAPWGPSRPGARRPHRPGPAR